MRQKSPGAGPIGNSMTSILTVSRLTTRFQAVEALKQVSLDLRPGMRVALLGHNGAGKSTLMKIVLGLIPWDAGEVVVCGARPGSGDARRQVSYLPENAAFHPALTGEEQIRHYLSLRGENPRQDRKSTRLNSSHVAISYAVFCLKKKNSDTTVKS